MEEIDCYIDRINENNIKVKITGSKQIKSYTLSRSNIKFRNGNPPDSLITVNTALKCKIFEGKIIEANITPNLEIRVWYGFIIQ
jgi:hypothetical protein